MDGWILDFEMSRGYENKHDQTFCNSAHYHLELQTNPKQNCSKNPKLYCGRNEILALPIDEKMAKTNKLHCKILIN